MSEPMVNVVTQSGATISVPADAARAMQASGQARPQTGVEGDEGAQVAAEEKRYDNPVGAAVLGVGRALTAGGSDWLIDKMGGGHEVAKIREHNVGASIGGEVVGSVLPVGAPGLVSKAARAAGDAIRGTSAVSRIGAGVVEGAIDGGAFSAAQRVSDAALGGDPLTIESIISSVGTGALFGGGIGGGLSGVAVASGAIRKKLAAKANPLLSPHSQGAKELGQHYGAALKEMDEGVEESFRRVRDKRAGELLQKTDKEVGGFATPPDLVAEVRAQGTPQPRGAPSAAALEQDRIATGGYRRPAAANPDRVPTGGGRRRAHAFEGSEAAPPAPDAPMAQGTGPIPKPGESAVAYAIRTADDELAEMRSAYRSARKGLVDRFGDDFVIDIGALARKPTDQALKSIQAIDDYGKAIQKIRDAAGDLVEGERLIVSRVEQRATPAVGQAFKGLGSMDRAAVADALKLDIDSLPQFGPAAEYVLKAYSVARFADDFTAKAAVAAGSARAGGNPVMAGALGAVGALLGGLPGAAVAALTWAVGHPQATLMRIATQVGKNAARMSEGIDKFVQVATRPGARSAYVRTGTAILANVRFAEREAEGSSPGVRRIRELRETVANPGRLDAFVDDQLAPLRAHNLDIGYQVADGIKRRLMFLAGKAPELADPDPFTGWQPEPSEAELSDWARFVEAAEDPLSLLDELASGHLAPESVEAVKELYPGLFEAMQHKIIEKVLERKTPLDYQHRLNLTQLYDVPIEPTAAPEVVAPLQEMYARQRAEQEAQQAQPKGTPKPASPTKGQQLTAR